jgi:hypothetical protein
MKRKTLALLAAVIVLVVGVAAAEVSLRRTVSPAMATVTFFSNNANGYACFLNYTYPLTGGPVCLSDDPSLGFPDNATVPLGSYGIVFFPFGTASNQSTWLGTNNIQVTGSAPYDVSSSYANITVNGDGAIAVFVFPDNQQRIPEFPVTEVVAFASFASSLYFFRRRRRR